MAHAAGRHTGPPVVTIRNVQAKRVAGRRLMHIVLYLASAFIVMLLSATLWDAVLDPWQVIGLVACVALLYVLGMMQGALSALGANE